MDRQIRFLAALRSAALAVALFVPWPSAVLAQPVFANAIAAEREEKAADPVAIPLAEQLSEARAQFEQAKRSRDAVAERYDGGNRQPQVADKLRLLDWLVDLLEDKIKRIDELGALRASANSPVDEPPLVKALAGPPPYPALQVDALRDEIDGLQEKLAAAKASYRANLAELQNLNAQLKARAANARRAGEATLGPRSSAQSDQAQGYREIADLLQRATEVDISNTALDQERLTLQIAALNSRIDASQAVLAKVLPRQRLSQDDLALQRQRITAEQGKLAEEIERVARLGARHRAERDKAGGQHGDAGTEAAYLDVAIRTDNALLKGLDNLQMLNGLSGDAWEKRYLVLTGGDPDQRRSALEALSELKQKLTDWRNLSHTRQESLRTEIRAQRVRIDNLAADRQAQGRETALLDLMLQQTAMDERTELAATRLERQVSRWLDDATGPGDSPMQGRMARLADGAAALLARIWNQELFVAEDVSDVEGRRVSVKYGVTVGKSLGIVVVFVLGYWLLARFSRLVQRQLVARLKLSHQIASMVRRWAMIVLGVALVVLILNLARIPLSVFAFAGGALAIGIGFGAQTIIKNFISGLILLFERKIRVGDIVELGGVTGHVTAVDLRAATILGFNGVEALIPNANFIEHQVINWTYSNRLIRRELKLGVAYGTDLRLTETLLLGVAAGHPHVAADPAPEVFFEDFGESHLAVALVFWVELDDKIGARRIDSDLRHGIYARLAEAGIAIPFPQREVQVHFAQPVPVRTTHERHLGAAL